MTTFGAPGMAVICLVASSPSITGIRTSIRTTSGCSLAASATACAPSAASPATTYPEASRITQKPARTSSWSSATSTRSGPSAITAPLQHRQAGGDSEAAGRIGPDGQRTAAGGHPLGDARQAEPVREPLGQLGSGGRGGIGTHGSGARVGDPDRHESLLVANLDGGPRPRRVPQRVGQRLLDDPVRGQVHPGRQAGRLADDLVHDRESGAADGVEHLIEANEGGGGSQPRPF